MTRREQIWAGIGVVVMIAASFLTWADGTTWDGEPGSEGGFSNGGVVVFALAVLAAIAVYFGSRIATFLCGFAAGLWMAYVVYTLPGDLTGEGFVQADIALGADLAFLGALVVVLAAGLSQVAPYFGGGRRDRREPPRSPAPSDPGAP